MIVVSDTTAITTLLKVGQERLLQDLFGHVFIPQSVQSELLSYHRALPDFISHGGSELGIFRVRRGTFLAYPRGGGLGAEVCSVERVDFFFGQSLLGSLFNKYFTCATL